MKNLTLRNIAAACGGIWYCGGKRQAVAESGYGGTCGDRGNAAEEKKAAGEKEVAGVVLDSRQVEEGYLFIATKGKQTDGHSFIPQVLQKGAAGVVCEKLPEKMEDGENFILVEDSFQALKDIAKFYREQLAVKVVGITGSVGKTSTKEFIASVLAQGYQVLKTEGNFNNEVGLPLTILKIRDCHQIAVVEMGISDFGEMHRLSEIAKPDVCVLTNIGQCHLENLKSRQGILKAKTEIFDFMGEDGIVCLNGDDDMLASVTEVKGRKPITFGRGESNRIHAGEVENRGLFGSSARIYIGDKEFHADIPLPGEHMVYNALAAACVGNVFGIGEEGICRGIAKVEAVGGRSHIIRLEDRVVIDDCYNANPVSVCAAIDLLDTALTRKVAVLGDMFELGEGEKEMHAKVGAYAVEKGIDVLICIGGLAEYMYKEAGKTAERLGLPAENIHYFPGKEDFLEIWHDVLKKGDTILIKASHGMEFSKIVKEIAE